MLSLEILSIVLFLPVLEIVQVVDELFLFKITSLSKNCVRNITMASKSIGLHHSYSHNTTMQLCT